jgi:NAD+ diphosphatase
MSQSFIPGITPPPEDPQPAWWFAFQEAKLLVQPQVCQVPQALKLAELGLQPIRSQYLGTLAGVPCYSAELLKDCLIPDGMVLRGLRELYGQLPDDLFALGGRAFQIMEWDRTHQFCATPTLQADGERAKRCPNCGLVNYPRLSPAIIVLIRRGEEVLLARAHRFPLPFYSVLAGFVEPGESLEETVVREVREEVGIEIRNIRYFGSQPWAFPSSLMIGFVADYAGGEIVLEEAELADAAWFKKDNLPQIPPKLSIARRLIDWFVDQPSAAVRELE